MFKLIEVINIKRAWIIPAVICLLLLVAWPFRWEKGPVQPYSDRTSKAKIIHIRDRWTGQAWIDLYGFVDNELVSGEMKPVHSQVDIAKRKKGILARPKEAQKRQELKNRWAKYGEIEKLNSAANAKYNELIKINRRNFYREQEIKKEIDQRASIGLPSSSQSSDVEKRDIQEGDEGAGYKGLPSSTERREWARSVLERAGYGDLYPQQPSTPVAGKKLFSETITPRLYQFGPDFCLFRPQKPSKIKAEIFSPGKV